MKTRSDSWWAPLKPADRDAAFEACLGEPFGRGAAILKERWGLAPSRSAYYRFFEAHADDYSAAAPVRAGIAQRYVARIAARASVSDDEVIAALKADLAAAQMRPGDSKSLQRLAQTIVSLRRLQLDAEKVRLDREKFEAAEKRLADARGAVEDATLTDEERVRRIKTVFGIQ